MPVSVAELLDLTQARCWVNEIGLRRSIETNDPAWEEAVLLSFHRLSRTPRHLVEGSSDRNPAWERAHRAFHRALIEACGSPWLIETCERLFDAAERYRHLARIAGVSRGSLEAEHREIMEAAIERRADQGVELLNLHFRRTADLVKQTLGASHPPARNASKVLQSTRG
jgi:DNA-binding GntR family transcriptional regulator